MSHYLFAVLLPIWVGILLNIAFSIVNIRLLGHFGPIATRWMKYSPWALGVAWFLLLGLAAYLAHKGIAP